MGLMVPFKASASSGVDLYFGQGCFWHVQRDMTLLETKLLERTGGDITSTAGYAGGPAQTPVCYHNLKFPARDYATLGHTEVVKVSVPEEKVGTFAKEYLDSAAWQRSATGFNCFEIFIQGSFGKNLPDCATIVARKSLQPREVKGKEKK